MSNPKSPEGGKREPYNASLPAGHGKWRKEVSDDELPTEEELQKLIYGDPPLAAFTQDNSDQEGGLVTFPGSGFLPFAPGTRRPTSALGGHRWSWTERATENPSVVQPSKEDTGFREPRRINEIRPEEIETYLAVPGWRIWVRRHSDTQEFCLSAQEAGARELSLTTDVYGKGYDPIHSKLEAIDRQLHPNGPRLPFGYRSSICTTYLPWYILEPLTADEVKTIDELGEASGPASSIDRAAEILRPDELKKILEEPDIPSSRNRFRPIQFPPATI
ncbi:hypothetical protein HYU95_00850 [Candidatus Daviesbacteria bacterium]|nr:hypothetical protein [Candidatus Daviesbacteria bacterium]